MSILGSNCNYLAPIQLKAMRFNRIETSLGRHMSYEDMVERNLEDIQSALALEMGVTVHLPIFLEESWRNHFDFYDGFYLDPRPELREMAFNVLETNLIKLQQFSGIEYYVIHFPGLYSETTDYQGAFDCILKESLDQLEQLAVKYSCRFALEYFASNSRFNVPSDWIRWIEPYEHLGILVDTGHLHFACLLMNDDFDDVLRQLSPHAIGFHLWNIKGSGAYSASEFYQKYHHIAPHPDQLKLLGWAFDTASVVNYLYKFDKPIIVEASCQYEGPAYFIEGLELLRNMTEC